MDSFHRRWIRFAPQLSFLTLLLLLNACSSAPKGPQAPSQPESRPSPAPQPTEQAPLGGLSPAESKAYRDIQKLFAGHQYEAALEKMSAYEKTYPRSPQIAHVYNLHGLAYLFLEKPLQAAHYFKRSVELAPNHGFRQYILYNLAAAQSELDQLDEAQGTLTEIEPYLLDEDTRTKFSILRGRINQKKQEYAAASADFLTASSLMKASASKSALGQQLQLSLQGISELRVLEDLYRAHSEAPLADSVLYRIGSLALAQGKPSLGEQNLKKLVEAFPNSTHIENAQDLLNSLESRKIVESDAIGVLLPLNGKFSAYGQKSLQAIQLALGVFGPKTGGKPLKIVIEDAGETPQSALTALNRLYFKHHVIAVIGPMLSKGVDQITQRAQELGLPILTLSQSPGIEGDYVFQAGLTPQLQAHEIARYAIENLSLKRFAILHSQDRFGDAYSKSFWDSVESLGGEVVGIETYAPGETDFRRTVDKLSGLYYTDARERELKELEKLREENKVTRRTRKTEHFYALKPIVDYDAVFIPDEPKIIGQILPTFTYRDVDNMRFLGISTWHSADLLKRAQRHAEGSIFVDAFDSESRSPRVRSFVDSYIEAFQEQPGQLEALAYDAGRIVAKAVNESNGQRDDVKLELRSVRKFPGVTGEVRYEGGQFLRDLHVIGVSNGKFINLREQSEQASR